jgi:pentose-5-phosphate-3-epimerase
MTVECGFGGQKFQEHVLDKVRQQGAVFFEGPTANLHYLLQYRT